MELKRYAINLHNRGNRQHTYILHTLEMKDFRSDENTRIKTLSIVILIRGSAQAKKLKIFKNDYNVSIEFSKKKCIDKYPQTMTKLLIMKFHYLSNAITVIRTEGSTFNPSINNLYN